jgi:hypothetical protein
MAAKEVCRRTRSIWGQVMVRNDYFCIFFYKFRWRVFLFGYRQLRLICFFGSVVFQSSRQGTPMWQYAWFNCRGLVENNQKKACTSVE